MAKPKEIILDGKTIHASVGAVIERDGKYLLIDRAAPPYGFAGIAGHIADGETPEQALVRKVQEEVGAKVETHELLYEELVDWNWCSAGAAGHYWHVFNCTFSGVLKENPEAAKSMGWYTPEEIQKLVMEPVWDYWFKKLKII